MIFSDIVLIREEEASIIFKKNNKIILVWIKNTCFINHIHNCYTSTAKEPYSKNTNILVQQETPKTPSQKRTNGMEILLQALK